MAGKRVTDDTKHGASSKTEAPLLVLLAHDLRQPIQAMLLNTHLLHEAPDGAVRQRARTLELQLIVLQRMLDLSSELALLESGSKAPDVRVVSSSTVFDGVRRSVGAVVSMELCGAGVSIDADPRLLQLMVEALVLNARKSGLQGGVTLSCEAAGKSWRVACDYAGAPFLKTLRKAYFIEVDGTESAESGLASVALGFAFVERLCRVLGYRLQVSQVTPGSQRIELICDP